MDWNDLYSRIAKGRYVTKEPFVLARKDREQNRRYRAAHAETIAKFESDCREAVNHALGTSVTDPQFRALFGKAWEDGHSSGLYEIVLYLEELTSVVKEFVNAQ